MELDGSEESTEHLFAVDSFDFLLREHKFKRCIYLFILSFIFFIQVGLVFLSDFFLISEISFGEIS